MQSGSCRGWRRASILVVFIAQLLLVGSVGVAESPSITQGNIMTYKTIQIRGLTIFYREAGDSKCPTLLLLHGFPSSSRMFDRLIGRLASNYHLVAPDYPGFGHSDAPDASRFDYSFDHITDLIDEFTTVLRLDRYALYMQDYGGPIGFRLALRHPDRITALIVQNAVAHEDGLGPLWSTRRAFWQDRRKYEVDLRENLLSFETTRSRHVGIDPSVELYDPDLWTDEFAFLNRPGQDHIQLDLFYDYRMNVASYQRWQAWLQKTQPKLLVLWGRYDPSFQVAEAEAYRRDVPSAEVRILDAGHFALDTKLDEIATFVNQFLSTQQKIK
jgi:pimeloyl-ACP methyl ester carboxylesterase